MRTVIALTALLLFASAFAEEEKPRVLGFTLDLAVAHVTSPDGNTRDAKHNSLPNTTRIVGRTEDDKHTLYKLREGFLDYRPKGLLGVLCSTVEAMSHQEHGVFYVKCGIPRDTLLLSWHEWDVLLRDKYGTPTECGIGSVFLPEKQFSVVFQTKGSVSWLSKNGPVDVDVDYKGRCGGPEDAWTRAEGLVQSVYNAGIVRKYASLDY